VNLATARRLFAYPFRVFFVLTGIWAAVAMGLWLAALRGAIALSPLWHAHELLFGVVTAAAAGFLLTASANWTASEPVRGIPLLGLALLWLGGRIVMLLPAPTTWFVPLVDLAFLPVLALVLGRRLVRARSRRNYGLPLVLLLLAAAQAQWHLGDPRQALESALLLVSLLVLIIGGRITPLFTANALRKAGVPAPVRDRRFLAAAQLALLTLAAGAAMQPQATLLAGAAALLAGSLGLLRQTGWAVAATLRDPLLWILHLGWCWLQLGLLAYGLAQLGAPVPRSLWIHLLGAGGLAAVLLGVMTRVSLGHTGRALVLPRGAVAIYLAAIAGGVLRAASHLPGATAPMLLTELAGLSWLLAWVLFLVWFAPVLAAARPDGRRG